MILLADVGNTRIKWAASDGEMLLAKGRVVYGADDVDGALAQTWGRLGRPERVVASNVAGTTTGDALGAWVSRHWGLPAHFVRPQAAAFGVVNGYCHPEQLGADRWAALVGAVGQFQPPLCVVDCGTAITLDAVASGGRHLGGLIVPGISTMRSALSDNTGALPHVRIDGAVALTARNTRDAISAGTFNAAVALVDRFVDDLGKQLDAEPLCVITGGDGPHVRSGLRTSAIADADLVLKGLAVIAGAPS